MSHNVSPFFFFSFFNDLALLGNVSEYKESSSGKHTKYGQAIQCTHLAFDFSFVQIW